MFIPPRLLLASPCCALTRRYSTMTHAWNEKLPEKTYTYLCICPDLPDSKRLSIRSQHLAEAKIAHENQHLVTGGALLKDDPSTAPEGDAPSMIGSWLLLRATSKDDCKRKLLQDIYATGGAFDVDKVDIKPVAIASL